MASTRAKFGFIKGSSIIDVAELPSLLPKGTAINPLGTYDKFYFNTSLSVEEVESICSKLTYGNLGGVSVYNVIWDINQSTGITIINMDGHIIIGEGISNVEGDLIAFTSHNPGNVDFVAGWKEFENPYPMSLTGDEEMGNYLGFPSGKQNELLSYLISSTPFESAKGINAKALYRLPDGTLWHYFNGQWNAVGGDEKGGTPINPTGTYDKIYFNTSLSTEEVDTMLSQLEYMKYDDIDTYGILVNSAFTQGILVMKGAFGETPFYIIAYQNQELNEMITVYSSASTGWQDESYSEFEFGSITGINEMDGTPIGHQNELLKNLISSTPFNSSSSNGIIEVDTLPTENINTKAIYKIPEKFVDSYIYSDGVNGLLSETYVISGAEVVETKPTSNIVEATMSALYLYYVTSENDIFLYMNIGAGATWYSASQILAANGLTGLTFKGVLLEGKLPTEYGYYAYYKDEQYYKYNNNKFDLFDSENNTLSKFFSEEIFDELELEIKVNGLPGHAFWNKQIRKLTLNCYGYSFVGDGTHSFNLSDYAFDSNRPESIFETIIINNCSDDENVILGGFGERVFGRTKNLKALVLNFNSIKWLPIGNNPFVESSIADGTSYIYVPDDVVDTVKALEGWSNYASQIKPLSEYKED